MISYVQLQSTRRMTLKWTPLLLRAHALSGSSLSLYASCNSALGSAVLPFVEAVTLNASLLWLCPACCNWPWWSPGTDVTAMGWGSQLAMLVYDSANLKAFPPVCLPYHSPGGGDFLVTLNIPVDTGYSLIFLHSQKNANVALLINWQGELL